MSTKIQATDDELPKNEKEFTIDVPEGDVTKQRYKGKFKCVCVQSLKQRAEADLMRARLNEGHPGSLSEETRNFHLVVSELATRLIKAPKWFLEADYGRELKDLNVLVAIFNECMNAEKDWRIAVWGPPKPVTMIEESEDEETEEKETKAEGGTIEE